MTKQTRQVDQHVGDQLSGFVDGELTQQERQIVSLHCEQCEACRNNLSELRELRERIGKSRLSEVGEKPSLLIENVHINQAILKTSSIFSTQLKLDNIELELFP